jgi:Na+-transporting NADH:ubiquinone oxidoreductase subunit NqrB
MMMYLPTATLILKNKGNRLEIPGFGTMISELERFQESTGYQFSDAEIGLISLAVVFIVPANCSAMYSSQFKLIILSGAFVKMKV